MSIVSEAISSDCKSFPDCYGMNAEKMRVKGIHRDSECRHGLHEIFIPVEVLHTNQGLANDIVRAAMCMACRTSTAVIPSSCSDNEEDLPDLPGLRDTTGNWKVCPKTIHLS